MHVVVSLKRWTEMKVRVVLPYSHWYLYDRSVDVVIFVNEALCLICARVQAKVCCEMVHVVWGVI